MEFSVWLPPRSLRIVELGDDYLEEPRHGPDDKGQYHIFLVCPRLAKSDSRLDSRRIPFPSPSSYLSVILPALHSTAAAGSFCRPPASKLAIPRTKSIVSTMLPAILVVALAALASAVQNASPFEAASTYALNGAGLTNGFDGLVVRDSQCLASQDVCGTEFCMPNGGSCCDKVKGTYCKIGYHCHPNGCCRNGKVCSNDGPTSECASGKKACGNVCIASSSVCCNPTDYFWCEYPKTCGTDGKCVGRALSTSASASPSSTSSSLRNTDATGDYGDTSTTTSNSSKGDKKTPVGAIVGGVVGGVAAIALVGVGVLLLLRHKKKQKDATRGQTMQQPPPNQSLMQQYPPQTSPYMSNVSPAQGMGYFPPHSPPPPQDYSNNNTSPPVGQYSPSMATGQASSPTGMYSTDPRNGASAVRPVEFATVGATPTPPSPAGQGHNGNKKPVVHEMSAKPGDDHRGNIHELA